MRDNFANNIVFTLLYLCFGWSDVNQIYVMICDEGLLYALHGIRCLKVTGYAAYIHACICVLVQRGGGLDIFIQQ